MLLSEPHRNDLVLEGIRVSHAAADGLLWDALSIEMLRIPAGTHFGVWGASGSGKSTLLHIIAGLLKADAGVISWKDCRISDEPEARRDAWRREQVGFVFQDFHLIPELDALANILLPRTFARTSPGDDREANAEALAMRLGIADLRRPARLMSRGEQQRVAVARALVHRPKLILADEPTASLDRPNAEAVARALVSEASALGATLICATHDQALLDRMMTVCHLVNGRPVMLPANTRLPDISGLHS